ncbi:MAG: hypothetical protein N2035_08115 [Chthoniobacterales bacterium]|nr:hypothetical protein [Chthoniobacterales bacterium]
MEEWVKNARFVEDFLGAEAVEVWMDPEEIEGVIDDGKWEGLFR